MDLPPTAPCRRPKNGLHGLVIAAAVIVLFGGWVAYQRLAATSEDRVSAAVTDLLAQVPAWHRLIEPGTPLSRWVPQGVSTYLHQSEYALGTRKRRACAALPQMGTNAWPQASRLVMTLARGGQPSYDAFLGLAAIRAAESPAWDAIAQTLDGESRSVPCLRWFLTLSELNYGYYQHPVSLASLRRYSLIALAATGKGGEQAIPELLGVVTNRAQHDLWPLAAVALVRTGADQARFVPCLTETLENSERGSDVRVAAADALALVSPEPAGVRDLFRRMMNDPSSHVRLASARALWKWKAPAEEILPTLKVLLGHKLVSIRKGALALLAEMGTAAQSLRPEIERLAQADADESVRAAAAGVLKVLNGAGGRAPSVKP